MNTRTALGPCALPAAVDAMAGNVTSAIHFRRRGAPTTVTFDRCRADADVIAGVLGRLGIGPDDRVAIHGATSYEWVLADLACLLRGALSVALYATAPAPRVLAVARESGCRVVFTDQADVVAAFREAGVHVVFLGPVDSAPPGVPAVGDLLAANVAAVRPTPAATRDGPFTVVSTSGTLSEPKLFAVHSAPLLYTMDRMGEIYDLGGGDRLLLNLPLSHLPQRMMLYWGLRVGMDFVLSDPTHMAADTAQFHPTVQVTVPRILEHVRRRVSAAVQRAGQDNAVARAVGYRRAFGEATRAIFVGSAPTDPALMVELLDAGLPVYEVYGTTELGMIGLNTPRHRRPGTVGRPIPWGEARVDPHTREIQVRTPTPFLYGRLGDDGVVPHPWSARRFEPTGDVGDLTDGFLTVRGRLRDFIALSSGEKVFVRPIEEAAERECGAGLCQVMRLDDGRLGALLFFEPGTRADDPGAGLRRVNQALHPWERVKAYAVVDRMPTVAEGCLTETTKPRRHVIEDVHGRTARWHDVQVRTGQSQSQSNGGR